jgi:TonB-linked SusC/RagA family outer membrane protein
VGGLLLASPAWAQQTGAIEGTVTNAATGDPIPGVNLVIVGTNQGAASGPNGEYQIQGVEPGTYTVRASFVGYTNAVQENVAVEAGETATVDFELESQAEALDEVVVVGYGEQQRKDLTGSVSSISVEAIEAAQPQTVDEALQGQVAGVRVTQSSNAPGGGISVRIRGNSSITAGSEPLYVIDGVPVYNDNSELDPNGGFSDTPSPNALAFLDPNDIESIEVLKDASAKAIYGARGSNGVVMIETKRGQSGRPQVNFQSTFGVKSPAKTIDVLNAQQYARMANEVIQISQQTDQRAFENPEALGEGTDFQDLIYDNALSQSYSLNAGGGNEGTTYYVSGSWSDGESIVRDTDTERMSVRASVEAQPYDVLTVGGTATGSRVQNKLAPLEGGARNAESAATAALQMYPMFPPRFENGVCPLMDVHDLGAADNYINGNFAGSGRNASNPVCAIDGTNDRYRMNRGLATLFVELAPFEGTALEGLRIETRGSADVSDVRRQTFFDRTTRTGGLGTGGQAVAGNTERTSLNFDVIPRYSAPSLPDWQSLNVTAGFSMSQEVVETRNAQNSDFPTDVTGFNDLGAGAQSGGPNAWSNKVQSTMVSGFGRVNYQLFDRYLITGTFRGDGSSRFGVNNRWGFFPSAALAWRLSEEDFIPELFSDLKLRGSWGRSGNQEIGEYAQFSSLGNAQYNFDGGLVGGLAPGGLGNPNLTWEETTEWNVALDASFLEGRISTSLDWFRQDTQELLLNVDLPPATGFGSATQNVGSLENTGVEFSLSTDFLLAEDVQWRQRFNISHVQNEVTDLGPNEIIFGGTFNGDGGYGGGENGNAVIPGEPLGVFWGWETDGIFRDQEEADAHSPQPNAVAGERRFVDHNGDGDITQEDKHVIGDPNPDFTFGWSNTFRYESLTLDVFFQGQVGNDIYNTTFQEIDAASTGHNTLVERYEDAWTPDNRDAKWPRIATPPGQGSVISTPKGPLLDVYLQDGSYLRAESISLTWNLADQFTLPWSTVRNMSLFAGVQNAFTITDYGGVDPDVNTEGQDNIRQGVDLGALPLSRNYQFGVRLGL